MDDDIIPRSNCIWKEIVHVYQTAAFYFMKVINIIISTVQRSAVSREFVFKDTKAPYYS